MTKIKKESADVSMVEEGAETGPSYEEKLNFCSVIAKVSFKVIDALNSDRLLLHILIYYITYQLKRVQIDM